VVKLALRAKSIIVGTAVFIICCMGVFPPWVFRAKMGGRYVVNNLGYSFIGTPPISGGDDYRTGQVDYNRLLLQWAIVAIAAGGLIYIPKKQPD
jgi:hypothetical protein